jgi:hypothetical protein
MNIVDCGGGTEAIVSRRNQAPLFDSSFGGGFHA